MAFNIPEDFFSDKILQFFNDGDLFGTDTFSEELLNMAPELDTSSSVFALTTDTKSTREKQE